MADLTKCFGNGCGLKDHCLRFTIPESKFYQSYFDPEIKDECLFFIDNGKK